MHRYDQLPTLRRNEHHEFVCRLVRRADSPGGSSVLTAVRDFDTATTRPLRVGIALGDRLWLTAPADAVRVQAVDLREARHRVAAIREESHGAVEVLVDINVVIARDAATARRLLTHLNGAADRDGALLYVGTPKGLTGLLADIRAVGIADGAVLFPLKIPSVTKLLLDEVLPELETMGMSVPVISASRDRQR